MSLSERLDEMLRALSAEVAAARIKHPPMKSAHEGRSVIREECDELWQHVMADTGDGEAAKKEALQIAAMGYRFAIDICGAQPDFAEGRIRQTVVNRQTDMARPTSSAHEGHAFIMDEYATLFGYVSGRMASPVYARNAALRLAAEAVGYALDVCALSYENDLARERRRANAMQS